MFSWKSLRSLAYLGLAIPGTALFYRDGPPVGHTGGFGEPTCHACHFDGALNSRDAWAGLIAPPAMFVPDTAYVLTVAVSRSDLGAGGFSMSSRFPDGGQAGSISPLDDRVAVESSEDGVQFAMHTLDGTEPSVRDSIFWRLRWIAPSKADTVLFHLAANASNGDDSELGDLIQTLTFRTNPIRR